MKVLIAALCILAPALIAQAAVQFDECFQGVDMPVEIRFNDCNSTLCVASLEDGVNIEADFIAMHPSTSLKLSLHLSVFGYPVSYEIEQVCDYLVDGSCPLIVGENYTLANNLTLPERARGLTFDSSIYLFDNREERHFCFHFSFKVV